ncbi:hypothetical protein [uncultured Mediterranean phage uvMED]|nr:hypothetical protein [uncultured Mediterranean phage uvMED]
MNKLSALLHYIAKNKDVRFIDMQRYIFSINHPKRSIQDTPRGYYCDGIGTLTYKGHIKKNEKKRYNITEQGRRYIDTPYAKTENEIKQDKQLKLNKQYYEQMKNRERFHDKWRLKNVDKRGHVQTVSDLIALLKEFPGYAKIDIAIDPEINATGPIASTVCVDSEDFMTEITLFPTHTKPV